MLDKFVYIYIYIYRYIYIYIYIYIFKEYAIYIYIYIYIYIFKTFQLKTMEQWLFLIVIFQVFLLFSLCWTLCRKGILSNLLPYLCLPCAEDMELFLYHLDLNTRKIRRILENLQSKIINKPCSIVFN